MEEAPADLEVGGGPHWWGKDLFPAWGKMFAFPAGFPQEKRPRVFDPRMFPLKDIYESHKHF